MTKLFQFALDKYNDIRKYFAPKIPLFYADNSETIHSSMVKGTALIFPPSDYWVLRVKINAKNEKEAAKYGPALFELDGSYRYEAQKIGENSYVLIAYDPEILANKLLALGDSSMIDKITFAQWVFDAVTYPIHIKDERYLTVIDGIVVEINESYLNKNTRIKINDLLTYPNPFLKTLSIESLATSTLTKKTLRTTFIILLVLFINFTALCIFNYQESSRLRDHIQELLSVSKLPETSIERDTLLGALRLKEKKQLDFRHKSHKISTLALDVKQPIAETKPSLMTQPLPPIPPVLTSPGDVVLIPGSNPGEQNRLLVEKSSSPMNQRMVFGNGIQELTYDGHVINLLINTPDLNTKEKATSSLKKEFKNAQISDQNGQLEVRLK